MLSKNRKTVSIVLAASLTATALIACSNATGETLNSMPTTSATQTASSETTTAPTETTPETTVEEGTNPTAIETTVVNPDYVRAVDGVTPEMMDS